MSLCINLLIASVLVWMLNVGMLIRASVPLMNEAQALMAFKAGISHDPSGLLKSWHAASNASSPCSQPAGKAGAVAVPWAGVVCDPQSRLVIAVNLSSGNLSGSISPSLAFLTALSRLDLSGNLLHGDLSDTLFVPGSPLRYLNLSFNLLEGELPHTLANLSDLRTLDLSYNKFSGGIPPSLGQLMNLKVLMLEHTGLAGAVAKEIWQLPSVKQLWITGKKFELLDISLPDRFGFCGTITQLVVEGSSATGSAIPSSLSDCRKLEVLVIDIDRLQGVIPSQIWQLPRLQVFVIAQDESSGSLSGRLPQSFSSCHTLVQLELLGFDATGSSIASSLGECNHLEILAIALVGLQGVIPPQIWQLPLLQTLIVEEISDSSQFSFSGSLPMNFSFCASIQDLEIDGVSLTGELPSSLGRCTSLQYLDLSHANLQGVIPNSWKNLTNLQLLFLQSNNLTGGIPTWLSAFSQLELLRLGDNPNFSGTIPGELGDLTQLQHLSLYSTFLYGPMPEGLCNCTQLVWLDLGWPVIPGAFGTARKVPDCMARLAQLQTLGWQMNIIDGEVPMKALRNLTQLQYLDMSFAQLRGSIPPEIGNFSQLQHLGFRQNNLTGSIPAEIGQLPVIESIDFSINSITGSIPEPFIQGLANGSSITTLSLSTMVLQGTIPNSIGGLHKLQILYLSSNNLHGGIPSTLGNCSALQDVDLQSNQLEGVIPSTLGQLTGLNRNLQLSSNNLSGKIPDELGALANLQVLDLSKNKLLGPLPKSLENCSNLQILRVSQNNLAEEIEHFNFSKLPKLQTFTALDNNFVGGLPRSFTDSASLVLFDVQRNNLSGSFDSGTAEINGLRNLRVLAMSYNNLSGTIPSWLWKLPMLQVLDLSNNHFSGTMPTTVSNLTYFKQNQSQEQSQSTLYEEVPVTIKSTFQVLSYVLSTRVYFDASMNLLEGEIAESFGDLISLTGLNLSHNSIQGTIPASLGKLINLDVLDLSHNNLTGTIPQQLASIGGLSVVDLSYNNLQGPIPTANNFNTRFDNSSFVHNLHLCGAPLPMNCSSGQQANNTHTTNLEAERSKKSFWRRVVDRITDFASPWAVLVGYAIGFLGVLYLRHYV